MADARLSIAGMYNYLDSMFDEMVLPIVPTSEMLGIPEDMIITPAMQQVIAINKPDLIGKICLDSAGFSSLYMDADLMKILIGVWSKSRISSWQRLYNSLFYKYNPIWNKDGYTERTHTDSTVKDTETTGTNDNRNVSSQYVYDKAMDLVRGFDNGNLQIDVNTKVDPLNVPFITRHSVQNDNTNEDNRQFIQSENTNNVENPQTNTHNPVSPKTTASPTTIQTLLNIGSGSLVENTSGNINSKTDNYTGVGKDSTAREESETVREYGNIGVTTSQAMIEAEQKLALFNIYDVISKEFVKKFCIMMY